MRRAVPFVFIALLLCVTIVFAQSPVRKVVEVPKVDAGAITIDGKMDETAWATAAHADIITASGFEVWANYYGRTLPEPDYDAIYGRMLWTDDTLYVFVHIDEFVNDSTKLYFAGSHYTGPGEHWKSDQLYVGLSNRLGVESWENWEGAAYTMPDGPYHLVILGDYVTFNDDEEVWIPEEWRSRFVDTLVVFNAADIVRSGVTIDTLTGVWDVEMAIYHPNAASQATIAFNIAGGVGAPGLDDDYGYWIWQPNVPDDPWGDPTGQQWNTYYIQQNSERWALLNLTGGTVGVDDQEARVTLPNRFTLEQNYPNPFNPSTVIAYALPKEARVTLEIYNLLGQKVGTLVDELQYAGSHEFRWNAGSLSSGVYFLHLKADGAQVAARKMVLLK